MIGFKVLCEFIDDLCIFIVLFGIEEISEVIKFDNVLCF